MPSNIDALIKLVLVSALLVAALAVWLLPGTRTITHRRIGDRAFVATQILGIACGGLGLALILGWPQRTLDWHLWELAVLPYAFAYGYWIIVMRNAQPLEPLDERQNSNMAAGAGLALLPLTAAMFAADRLQYNGLLDATLWFPYFFLAMIVSLSASTLVVCRRG